MGGNKGPDRLLRCGGRDTALTRQHHGRNEALQCGCSTGREAQTVLLGPTRWGHVSKPWEQPRLRVPSPPFQGNTGVQALWGPRLSSLPPHCGRSCPRPAVGPPHCQKAPVSDLPPTHTADELVSRALCGRDSGACSPHGVSLASSRRPDRLGGAECGRPAPEPRGALCALGWTTDASGVLGGRAGQSSGESMVEDVGLPRGSGPGPTTPPTPAPIVQNDGIILNHSHAPGITRITCRFGAVCPEAKVIWDVGWGGRF